MRGGLNIDPNVGRSLALQRPAELSRCGLRYAIVCALASQREECQVLLPTFCHLHRPHSEVEGGKVEERDVEQVVGERDGEALAGDRREPARGREYRWVAGIHPGLECARVGDGKYGERACEGNQAKQGRGSPPFLYRRFS